MSKFRKMLRAAWLWARPRLGSAAVFVRPVIQELLVQLARRLFCQSPAE